MELSGRCKLYLRTHRFDIAVFLLRFMLCFIFVASGASKIIDLLAGQNDLARLGFTSLLAWGFALGELLAGIMLLSGFATEIAARFAAITMIGAIAFVHGKNGFSIYNNGYEYSLLILIVALSVLLMGPGKFVLNRRYGHTTRSLREAGVEDTTHPQGT